MPTIPATIAKRDNDDAGITVSWPAMAAGDDGAAFAIGSYSSLCIAFTGTFGSTTMTFQGSNDGTNWFTLNDLQTSAISKTSAALEQVAERPRFVRPLSTGGSGVAVTATLYAQRSGGLI